MGFFADHGSDGEVPKVRLYYLGLQYPGSVAAAVGTGSHTVTPGSVYGISVGSVLTVTDNFLSAVATAPSPATSGTSMVLTTGDGAKLPPTPFYANVWPAAELFSSPNRETVQVTNVTGDTLTIVRAVSPRAIVVGDNFAVSKSDGSVTDESITVSGTALTTFTATFANPHPAGWLFSVPIPVYWTDYDLDIIWDSHTWSAQPITQSLVTQQPDGAQGVFRIADANNTLFALLNANNGAEMAAAEIYEAGFLTTNKTAVPDEVKQIFAGLVDRCQASSANDDNITITLMPPIQQTSGTLPTRLVTSLVRVT